MFYRADTNLNQFVKLKDGNNGKDENPMKITMTMLDVVLVISTLLYFFCLVMAKRKLSLLHEINPSLGLKKLLVLSVFTVCAIRIMTLVGVTCMDVANVRAHYSPSPAVYTPSRENEPMISAISNQLIDKKNQKFYDASMAVLWDLPNTIVVSTYILLTLVWCECFMQSRIHTENTIKWKRRWMLGYTIFNACLYFTQLSLYILVIVDVDGSRIVRNILYAAMTGTNFCAVALVTFLYIYLNFEFAGFPARSPQAKKALTKISKVMAMWTVSRVLWAIVMLIVYMRGIDLLHFSSTLLFFLFIICEILPIIAMLDYSYMQIIRFAGDRDNLEVSALVEQEFSTEEDLLPNGITGSDHDDLARRRGIFDASDWLGSFDESFGRTTEAEDDASDGQEPLLLQV